MDTPATFGFLSIVPALLAIGLAIVTRDVIVSLVSAVLVAGIIYSSSLGGGIAHAVDTTLVNAVADVDHAKTMLFTLLIGGMVGVVGRSGATRALVEALARRARTPRAVQVLSWLSGLLVFFDDYANCMIVGSAMGPLYDKHRISREKLAYIVDSTAAPVACLALVSTWVGFEVGVIQEGLDIAGQSIEPYGFFVQGWAYRFYPIFTLVFVGAVVVTGRDFGPMARERHRAPTGLSDIEETGTAPWWAALTPIAVLIVVTITELWRSGSPKAGPGAPIFRVLENADGYGAIVHGALASLAVALVLTLATRALPFPATMKAMVDGMKLMFEALVVLVLAWALSSAMKELSAPQYLVGLLRTALPVVWLPTVTFLVGAAISFAVGSSYTTMGILMPIAVPLAFELGPDGIIPLAASGSVLAGACFGDHCSPISDTTVLASIGSRSNLLAHVRTQLPYALAAGAISIVFGTIPAGFGLNPWICMALGAAACVAVVRLAGRPGVAGADATGAEKTATGAGAALTDAEAVAADAEEAAAQGPAEGAVACPGRTTDR